MLPTVGLNVAGPGAVHGGPACLSYVTSRLPLARCPSCCSYFNLAGQGSGSVLNHTLVMNS